MQDVSSGPVVAMELMGEEAISVWRRLLGQTESTTTQGGALESIRAQFGADGVQNAAHGSDSVTAAARVRHVMLMTD